MAYTIQSHLQTQLREIEAAGLLKRERVITSPQQSHIHVTTSATDVINLCANNYLGLADHPRLCAAAKAAIDRYGYGLASVRFICGTQDLHKQLESTIARFLQTDDAILYTSCFDANGGLFETLLAAEDAIISDELNHASIIDGVRLCKATRFRYKNNDMADLETQLKASHAARFRMIATDGVFSMDGTIANLPAVCDLADKYDALVMVDDSHAAGFLGAHGRGTPEHTNTLGRIDVITGTLGKALGGASGGYTAGRQEIIDLLRQRSRPYLFSNTLPPPIAAASIEAIRLASETDDLRNQLWENTRFFRAEMTKRNFDILPGTHPIVPIMFYDAKKAAAVAERMLTLGVYVVAFSYPVVPMGRARIRTQMSAAHTRDDLEKAIAAFDEARRTVDA